MTTLYLTSHISHNHINTTICHDYSHKKHSPKINETNGNFTKCHCHNGLKPNVYIYLFSIKYLSHAKRWIPIRSMGCVPTHQGMPTIKGWGSQVTYEILWKKNGKDNRKAKKTR